MWTLIIFIYAGVFAKGDSVAVHSVKVDTEQACIAAGNKTKTLVDGTAKEAKFVCVRSQ